MKAGDEFKHRYNDSLTCTLVRQTARGWEVRGRLRGQKDKRAFYDLQDFQGTQNAREGRHIWERVEVAATAEAVPRDVSASGKEAPAGYRWVYGELEKLPEAVPEVVGWEVEDFTEVAAGMEAINPVGTRYRPISPDESDISIEGTTYERAGEAIAALVEWCKRYRGQGGYRDNRGDFIPYVELINYCNVIPVKVHR